MLSDPDIRLLLDPAYSAHTAPHPHLKDVHLFYVVFFIAHLSEPYIATLHTSNLTDLHVEAPVWLHRYMLCGYIADFSSFSLLTVFHIDTHCYERTRNILDYLLFSQCLWLFSIFTELYFTFVSAPV